jgi:lipid-A-disaccharide synthase
MEAAGAELLADTAPLGAIGLWEALPLVLPTLRLQRKAQRWLAKNPPDGVVLIDYMGGNTPLGRWVKRERPEVPVLYYIAPQEWAFRIGEGGTTRLIGFSDQILAIFPEEARFYRERGAEVDWVGHPLIDTLGELPSRDQARHQLGLAADESWLLLLPASRTQELLWLVLAHAVNGRPGISFDPDRQPPTSREQAKGLFHRWTQLGRPDRRSQSSVPTQGCFQTIRIRLSSGEPFVAPP